MGAPAPSDGSAEAADRAALRFAMLSVYYGSLGRELSSQGAPAVLLPLPLRPLALEDALEEVRTRWPGALRDAVWRVVRSVPRPTLGGAGRGADRYPAALRRVLDDPAHDLGRLDELRATYAQTAGLCVQAADAVVADRPRDLEYVLHELESAGEEHVRVMGDVLAAPPAELLDEPVRTRARDEVAAVERDAQLRLPRYAAELADAQAFLDWWGRADGMTVLPAATLITQETDTLVTRVTVTALVECHHFDVLAVACDPQCWDARSDVVTMTRYVDGPYEPRPLDAPPAPGRASIEPGADDPLLLEERVQICWGFDDRGSGTFHNVLHIPQLQVDDARHAIDVSFALARSIDSRILWDARPGGILVDQGYLRARPTADGRWRLTSHKTLLFSDRTPNASAPGWADIGQLANYLAPAALSWWLESEMLSNAHPRYAEIAKERQ
jgi:hypothetical protein